LTPDLEEHAAAWRGRPAPEVKAMALDFPRMAVVAAFAASISGIASEPAFSATTDTLQLDRKIPLGDVSGRIDHLAIDLAKRHLFIAELGNNTVGVIDIGESKVVHRFTGLKEPQGVGYARSTDRIYVANAGDGSVHQFKAADFSALGSLKLGDDADNIRVDPVETQVIVGYGSGALALLDAASHGKVGEIRLAAHPESFQLEKTGPRIFVNVPDAHEVAVVDRAAGRQVASWKPAGLEGNFPMAIDDRGERLAVIYRKPAALVIFDTGQGAVITRAPTCGDADDVFFDTKRQRLYVSCGEGAIAVFQKQGETYRELGRVPTVAGARTSLWVPELDRLFLAVRATGREPAAVWVYRPAT
jgi:DNA-binding beta-propeller fold protein YncE